MVGTLWLGVCPTTRQFELVSMFQIFGGTRSLRTSLQITGQNIFVGRSETCAMIYYCRTELPSFYALRDSINCKLSQITYLCPISKRVRHIYLISHVSVVHVRRSLIFKKNIISYSPHSPARQRKPRRRNTCIWLANGAALGRQMRCVRPLPSHFFSFTHCCLAFLLTLATGAHTTTTNPGANANAITQPPTTRRRQWRQLRSSRPGETSPLSSAHRLLTRTTARLYRTRAGGTHATTTTQAVPTTASPAPASY